MRCACCDAIIGKYAYNQELCYECIDIIKNYWCNDDDRHGSVYVMSDEEIAELYKNKEYISLEY